MRPISIKFPVDVHNKICTFTILGIWFHEAAQLGTVAWEQSIAFIFRVEEIYVGVSEEFLGFYQSTRHHTLEVSNYSEAHTKPCVNW